MGRNSKKAATKVERAGTDRPTATIASNVTAEHGSAFSPPDSQPPAGSTGVVCFQPECHSSEDSAPQASPAAVAVAGEQASMAKGGRRGSRQGR
eukprot:CAMPEP_0172152668 /NCGR_PEP_ID=MMETSP1050-20130122/981_1 /TAXON_ID=233186 /ORGANISM="Cryptomonas curvata, Strain CCAP979/52" /LENGTH=93 /DNA_ID=CAMNT_0012821047 /DNA_START=468 /DNA_END=745 /DNA_ORIENTATION=+